MDTSTSTGGIGGVPAMPEINASSSIKKLELAEEQLTKAILKVNALAVDHPELQAKLQASIDLIKANFAKIIQIKYGESVGDVLAGLSTEEIDALNAQIDALTQRIVGFTTALDQKTAELNGLQTTTLANLRQTLENLINSGGDPGQIEFTRFLITETEREITVLQSQVVSLTNALSGFQAQLLSLQEQLQVAQDQRDQAIALFHSFTPQEQALFRLLYPEVQFPV